MGCSKAQPSPDPLQYLRVGVDPLKEGEVAVSAMRANGFAVETELRGERYYAFDAWRAGESEVRVITERGTALAVQAPDLRVLQRQRVALSSSTRLDFDGDGESDVVVVLVEKQRSCLAWVQIDSQGFVTEVFLSLADWGESPCVREIRDEGRTILLEVNVPECGVKDARVQMLVGRAGSRWRLLQTPEAQSHWAVERGRRTVELEQARDRGDISDLARLGCEIGWIDELRGAPSAGDSSTERDH
jgi:hypothetical protein